MQNVAQMTEKGEEATFPPKKELSQQSVDLKEMS